MSYNVTVNFNGSSFSVRFDPSWNIARLKSEIARIKKVDARGIKIIFAGQELSDTLTLKASIINSFIKTTHKTLHKCVFCNLLLSF